jgi:hypothetical protein
MKTNMMTVWEVLVDYLAGKVLVNVDILQPEAKSCIDNILERILVKIEVPRQLQQIAPIY